MLRARDVGYGTVRQNGGWHMAIASTPRRPRFGLGATIWISIVAVLLVVLTAAFLSFR
jgi:hypothetical protein